MTKYLLYFLALAFFAYVYLVIWNVWHEPKEYE